MGIHQLTIGTVYYIGTVHITYRGGTERGGIENGSEVLFDGIDDED